MVFVFNHKITFNSKYLTCVIFYLQLMWFTYSTRPQFNNFLSSLDSQQILKLSPNFNQCTHGNIWPYVVAQFQRSRSGCEWFDTHIKCVAEVSLRVKFDLTVLGSLSFPAGKIQSMISARWGKWNVFGRALIWTFWCGEFSPEVCQGILHASCICV